MPNRNSWVSRFITVEYIAWDETQANIIGRFSSYEEAEKAVIDYAESLKPNLREEKEWKLYSLSHKKSR